MNEIIVKRENCGLEVADKVRAEILRIADGENGGKFELARILYTNSLANSAFVAEMCKQVDSKGVTYKPKDYAKYCEMLYGISKTDVYAFIALGAHVERVDNGKPHGAGYKSAYRFTLMRDAMKKPVFRTNEVGAPILTVSGMPIIESYDTSAYDFEARDFGVSIAAFLCGKSFDYDVLIYLVRNGKLSPTMTVREIKSTMSEYANAHLYVNEMGVDAIKYSAEVIAKKEDAEKRKAEKESLHSQSHTFAYELDGKPVYCVLPLDVLAKYTTSEKPEGFEE